MHNQDRLAVCWIVGGGAHLDFMRSPAHVSYSEPLMIPSDLDLGVRPYLLAPGTPKGTARNTYSIGEMHAIVSCFQCGDCEAGPGV